MSSGLAIGSLSFHCRSRVWRRRSFTTAQRIDIGSEHLDRHRIEPTVPARHYAIAGLGHGGGDTGTVAAIKPDRVGELRSPEFAPALAVCTVTDSAVRLEDGSTARRGGTFFLLAADDANMAYDIGDLPRVEN